MLGKRLVCIVLVFTLVAVLIPHSPVHPIATAQGNVEWAVEAIYDNVRPFSEGLAVVRLGDKWGFINADGSVAIPLSYDFVFPFSEGLAVVSKGGQWVLEGYEDSGGVYRGGQWGFIDKTGAEVIPLIYDRGTASFSEGLAVVVKDEKYGYIDKAGTVVLPLVYDYAGPFSEGLAFVSVVDEDAHPDDVYYGIGFGYINYYIDKTGETRIHGILVNDHPGYSKFYNGSQFVEGFALVGWTDTTARAIIDKEGNLIQASQVIEPIKEGMAIYADFAGGPEGLMGYINTQGEVVIPELYIIARSFSESLAAVATAKDWIVKFGYINKGGNEVIPFVYDHAASFSEGLAWVNKGGRWNYSYHEYATYEGEGKWGLINATGSEVAPFEFDDTWDFSEGLAAVRVGSKWGFIRNIYTQNSIPQVHTYIYDTPDTGASILLPLHLLDGITDKASAMAAIEAAAQGMTAEEKLSATGIDLMTLFAEEAMARASSTAVADGNIIISQSHTQSGSGNAREAAVLAPLSTRITIRTPVLLNDLRTAAENTLASNGIAALRDIRADIRFTSTAETLTITIDPSAADTEADNIRVEAAGFTVTFSAESIRQNAADTPFEITITRSSPNTYNIEYNQPVNENIKISLPPLPGDPAYQAIFDADGNAIGGKFNPVTGMLEAKTNPSQTLTVRENRRSFTDISGKSKEMQDAISILASKGIINGTTATTFSPDGTITRAEIAALIVRTLSKLDPNADGGFTDVGRSDWFYGAVGSARRHGIVNGTSPTTFAPRSNIQKDQIVAICARTLRTEMRYRDPANVSGILSAYSDAASIAQWGREDIALATRENLVVRRTDGNFNGSATMTRGDAAVILYRMFMKIW